MTSRFVSGVTCNQNASLRKQDVRVRRDSATCPNVGKHIVAFLKSSNDCCNGVCCARVNGRIFLHTSGFRKPIVCESLRERRLVYAWIYQGILDQQD